MPVEKRNKAIELLKARAKETHNFNDYLGRVEWIIQTLYEMEMDAELNYSAIARESVHDF